MKRLDQPVLPSIPELHIGRAWIALLLVSSLALAAYSAYRLAGGRSLRSMLRRRRRRR